MRRRTLLASGATALAPALAGCSPCGETWTGVSFAVAPSSVDRRDGGWRIDADVSVNFNFGRTGAGVDDAALAAFDADGRLLGTTSLGDLLWNNVPEGDRSDGDCGSHGTLRRSASVRADGFPRWVGLRFDRASRAIDAPHSVARYPTSSGRPTADDYEQVPLPLDSRDVTATPGRNASSVEFDVRDASCDDAGGRVDWDRAIRVRWYRDLPAPRFRPALAGVSVDDGRLLLDVGLVARPRFRRLPCPREAYVATVDVESPDAVDAVQLRHLDPGGEVVGERGFDRPPSGTATGTGG